MVKKKKAEVKYEETEDDFWTDEDDDEVDTEDIDVKKLKFTKLKDLQVGMTGINILATVDFVGPTMGTGYGDQPFAPGFLKDETGEIKITFWGDDIKKAKPKKSIRIIGATVTEFRGTPQINASKKRGIDFL